MRLDRTLKRNDIVSYVVAMLIVFLIVTGFIRIRRPNN